MAEKKFRVATLGCRTNQYESQAYRDQLVGLGYQEAQGGESADLCIINTCTVTASADSHSRHEIRKLVRENEGAEVVVTGCLAQRRPDLIEAIAGVTRIVPNLQKEQLIADLFEGQEVPEFSIKHFESHTRAFVKVQDGCNSFCTYCIIPYVRGRSRSRPIQDVCDEVRELIKSGFKEVVITGINVGDYEDGERRLADLIEEVDRIAGLKRLRLSSIDPDEVDERLIEVILKGKTTCHSLHIVLQAGSNVTLKRMNRKYSRQVFLETVSRLKSKDRDFTFTTDVIVGFPGETEKDFEETLAVMDEVKFAKVHMFPYSKRERTRAALYPDQVPENTVKERKMRVLEQAEKNSFELRELFVGKEMTVLTENDDEMDPEIVVGHTENFLTVRIAGGHFQSNELVRVKLIENTARGLTGVPL